MRFFAQVHNRFLSAMYAELHDLSLKKNDIARIPKPSLLFVTSYSSFFYYYAV